MIPIKKIFVKYNNPIFSNFKTENDVYVVIDDDGYSYQGSILDAEDFKTLEKALAFAGKEKDYSIVEITITMTETVILKSTLSQEAKIKRENIESLEEEIRKLEQQLKDLRGK